jgi:hypothetical protein
LGVAWLAGNVQIVEKGRTMFADSVVYWPSDPHRRGDGALVRLIGSVSLKDTNRTLWADTLTYRPDLKWGEAKGRVRVIGDGQTVEANRALYDDRAGTLIAEGAVMLADSAESTIVRGKRIVFEPDRNEALITGRPMLSRGSPDGTLEVEGDTMRLSGADTSRQASVWGGVTITRGLLHATCDSLRLNQAAGRLWLRGRPQAIHNTEEKDGRTRSVVLGERMDVFLHKDMRIRQIEVVGRAEGTAVETDEAGEVSGEGWVVGKSIAFSIDEDQVTGLRVVGTARSWFRPADTNEFNEASGDTIQLGFEDGRMRSVNIRGGVQGLYRTPTDTTGGLRRSSDVSVFGKTGLTQGVAQC